MELLFVFKTNLWAALPAAQRVLLRFGLLSDLRRPTAGERNRPVHPLIQLVDEYFSNGVMFSRREALGSVRLNDVANAGEASRSQ
jgi:hypothetical protein